MNRRRTDRRWISKVTPSWVGIYTAFTIGIGFLAGLVYAAIKG